MKATSCIPCSLLLLTVCFLAPNAHGEEGTGSARIKIVKKSGFVPATPTSSWAAGQSLCETRCNALATDYLNVVEPGGWGLTLVERDRQVVVDLENPFLAGQCICVVDEYKAKRTSASNSSSPFKRAPVSGAARHEGDER